MAAFRVAAGAGARTEYLAQATACQRARVAAIDRRRVAEQAACARAWRDKEALERLRSRAIADDTAQRARRDRCESEERNRAAEAHRLLGGLL